MNISTLQTIQPQKKGVKASNILVYISAIMVAIIVVFFGKNILNGLINLGRRSAIAIDISNARAEVLINDNLLGTTPFESSDIKPGIKKVTIRTSNRSYETNIDFLANKNNHLPKVEIYRDLGISDLFSSGKDLWFDEDTTNNPLRIISEPANASVYIDNTEIGKTPFTSSKLTEGDYDIRIEKTGYEPQKVRIKVRKGLTSNISAKLFPLPVPSRVSSFEGNESFYDLSSDNQTIVSDTETWVKAIIYWNQTRGINLEGVGLNMNLVFDYFVDYKGTIYDSQGSVLTDSSSLEGIRDAKRGAYLGRISDGDGITQSAKDALNLIKGTQITQSEKYAKIKPTGLGWLRVRSEPSINSAEVAKVDEGKEYAVLEEGPEWTKIIVTEKTQGWVSSTYVDIVNKSQE